MDYGIASSALTTAYHDATFIYTKEERSISNLEQITGVDTVEGNIDDDTHPLPPGFSKSRVFGTLVITDSRRCIANVMCAMDGYMSRFLVIS